MPIMQIQSFLDEGLYDETITYAQALLKENDNQFSTNRFWNPAVCKDSFPVLTHNFQHGSDLWKRLIKAIEDRSDYTPVNGFVMLYYWTRFSYIPWHHDGKVGPDGKLGGYDAAVTVYLNRVWDKDFGGYFLYEDGEEVKAILPQRNLGLVQWGGVKHATTPVSFNGDIRISLQSFLACRK